MTARCVSLATRRQKRFAIWSSAVALFLGTVWLAVRGYIPPAFNGLNSGFYNAYSAPFPDANNFANFVASLWRPHVHNLHNSTYVSQDGHEYQLDPNRRIWQKPLGKDVLILNIDTRYDDSYDNEKEVSPRRAGWLNHYIYSLIHGYDYKFVHAPRFWFRHVTWVKVPMIRRALQDYRFVVFLDADAVFEEPQIPLEWLFDRWNIHSNTLVAMAEDPNLPRNLDSQGRVLLNTGFIIAQNSKRTTDLFWDWEQCPTDFKFPGCKHWTQDWAHEQAAFGFHVRYAYNDTDELRAISCMDGNGSPHIDQKACGGVFVAHHWSRKRQTVGDLGSLISRGLELNPDGPAMAEEIVRQMGGKLHTGLSKMLLGHG
ncbi:hypothetical protein F5X68DRAFT_198685 [Plectosphaerella plurivora]|uniref:Nucleotide-diphospho-sugar transferase domain-containing protein n=1 Tax=Plectosphaerella plurivora TaxID=936078 RepID=A0A9P8VL49_9PEZI|nr:hypothetical protein F5X68DRAFT_198685 [Plectosphaerella plurivora]